MTIIFFTYDMECAAASNTTTEVSWDSVSGADEYRVAKLPSNPDTEPDWAETDETTNTLNGLAEGTKFIVQAGNKHGWGDTAQCEFTVPPPTCLTTHNGIAVVWSDESSKLHRTLKQADLGLSVELLPSHVIYSFGGTNVEPNTAYTFTIDWWHTRTGPPVGSQEVTCTTKPAP